MAKNRWVNTRFWSDNFVREHLNPLDRYLFLYFLTNEKTNICGIYEMPLSTMASETGLEKEMLIKMLERLKAKIEYYDGWIIIRNFMKYQRTGSKDFDKGIQRIMKEEIPPKIRVYAETLGQSGEGLGTVPPPSDLLVPIPIPIPIRAERGQTPSEIAREFFEKGENFNTLIKSIVGHFDTLEVRNEIERFISYWTEPNKSGTKVRWEQEPTFEIGRRLKTWFARSKVGPFVKKESKVAFS